MGKGKLVATVEKMLPGPEEYPFTQGVKLKSHGKNKINEAAQVPEKSIARNIIRLRFY